MYVFDAAMSWSREAVVANVFISHTGADIGWAEQIHQWLLEDAHKVFLDSDQGDGVRAGEEWRPRLYERLRWADAVICVVTPAYLESAWCAAEIGAAQALGSEILLGSRRIGAVRRPAAAH